MPRVMVFVMAPFASGLQLYWVTSNVLTISQQWWLYRDTDLHFGPPRCTHERGDTDKELDSRARSCLGNRNFLKSEPKLGSCRPECARDRQRSLNRQELALQRSDLTAGLARTSNTPGRTQELNFFDVGARRRSAGRLCPTTVAEAPKDLVKRWRLLNDYPAWASGAGAALVLVDSVTASRTWTAR